MKVAPEDGMKAIAVAVFIITAGVVLVIDLSDLDIGNISNLDKAVESQLKKLELLRNEVRKLRYVPVDPVGDYNFVAYKAIDGGRMKINFNPLEIDFVNVSDSNDVTKMQFAFPRGNDLDDADIKDMLNAISSANPLINNFVQSLGESSISEVSDVYKDPDALMEIGEWACIFERIKSSQDPTLVIKDGLLRTKKIKSELIRKMLDQVEANKKMTKLVGVSKTSSILTLISSSLSIEKIFPTNGVGYVKIPRDLELLAYTWSGKGLLGERKKKRLYFAFGDLYIAKLSPNSNLLVTVEIPRDLSDDDSEDRDIYSPAEVSGIMGHLAKNSRNSYPILGYPQTLVRAHEAAARVGFSASIVSDRVKDVILSKLDEEGEGYMRDAEMIDEYVSKGVLGGTKNVEWG